MAVATLVSPVHLRYMPAGKTPEAPVGFGGMEKPGQVENSTVQGVNLCVDSKPITPSSQLRDGDFLHPKPQGIADVERHPPSGDHEDEEGVLRKADSPNGSP
eukprot:897142-Alexandrium_andersonii.AAC.1